MTKNRNVLRHPLAHPAEAMCTLALCAAGQLLLGWAFSRATQYAERADLQPVV